MENLVQKAILGDTDAFLELMEKNSLSILMITMKRRKQKASNSFSTNVNFIIGK